MAHNIETNGDQAAFVSAREDAWHQLGTTLPDSFTAEEAMEHGHLGGWDVRKAPLFADAGAGLLEVPNQYAMVRNNPFTPGRIDTLGVVGRAYHPIQNEEHAGFLNALVDESGAIFETAGSIEGGRKVFITMKMPHSITIGGSDPVDNYIAAVNSHDGSMAFTLMVTPVRVVCQNTLNVALGTTSNIIRTRHSRGAANLVQQAREALGMAFKFNLEFEREAEKMAQTTLTQARFEEIIDREFGAGENPTKTAITRAENRKDIMHELFAEANTQEGIRDTVWAGFNALTEYVDHYQPVRGDQGDRAARTILDNSMKVRARNIMMALV